MCAHYKAENVQERIHVRFWEGLRLIPLETDDIWPRRVAPFIWQTDEGPELQIGRYGLVPRWVKDLKKVGATYNARSEEVANKPSYRDAWKRGRRCIIPVDSFFEFCYETGKPVPWRMSAADGLPMGMAGLWEAWPAPDGTELLSFTMFTVNAAGHPIMGRMHKPEDEKRMPVILDPADFVCWLESPVERMRDFMRPSSTKMMSAQVGSLSAEESCIVAGAGKGVGNGIYG